MPMVHLKDFILQKQAEWGKEIPIKDIVEKTGVSRDTVSRLMHNKAKNVHQDTIFALCEYFGIPKGQPIPFIVYDPD